MASTSSKPPPHPLTRLKRRMFVAILALVAVASAYLTTPFYWVSEAVYWEALHQNKAEQNAIRWLVANRKDSNRPEWSNSFRGVVLDGAHRGNNREFTYRHKQKRWWIPEGAPILPFAHAWRGGHIHKWVSINWNTMWFLAGYYTGLGRDPTGGAVLYKVDGHPNGWFETMIRTGRLCEGKKVDAHVFYKLCEVVSLKGSRASVLRAYQYAISTGKVFLESAPASKPAGMKELVPTSEIRLVEVSFPYVLPEVHTYVARLAAQYSAHCGEALVVTSALRPKDEQPSNASTASVHPTGMAVDLSVSSHRCIKWLEKALLTGENRGYLDATREQFPPHFHVVLFPEKYRKWLQNQ